MVGILMDPLLKEDTSIYVYVIPTFDVSISFLSKLNFVFPKSFSVFRKSEVMKTFVNISLETFSNTFL